MSAPLRFLGVAVLAYVGLRTASSALALQPISGVPVPPPATPLLDPADGPSLARGYAPGSDPYAYGPAGLPQGYVPMPVPIMPAYLPAPRQTPIYLYPPPYPSPNPPGSAAAELTPATFPYERPVPALEQWPAIGTVGPVPFGEVQRTPSWRNGREASDEGPLLAARQRNWSLDGWALVRPPREGVYRVDDPGRGLNPSLAPAGSLGGSQAGLRFTWRPMQQVGVHLRASTALMPQGRGGQAMAGGEGALGVSVQPLRSIPVRLLAERRQRLGPALGGGRNAFAVLAEGGFYDRALPYGIRLDGYGQAGVVGLRSRDLFADGALAASYPIMPRLAIGGGMWGGTQPGLYRVDAGPRLSYQLSPNLRAHLDYRFRVVGNADPQSGPALTLAAGF